MLVAWFSGLRAVWDDALSADLRGGNGVVDPTLASSNSRSPVVCRGGDARRFLLDSRGSRGRAAMGR